MTYDAKDVDIRTLVETEYEDYMQQYLKTFCWTRKTSADELSAKFGPGWKIDEIIFVQSYESECPVVDTWGVF